MCFRDSCDSDYSDSFLGRFDKVYPFVGIGPGSDFLTLDSEHSVFGHCVVLMILISFYEDLIKSTLLLASAQDLIS